MRLLGRDGLPREEELEGAPHADPPGEERRGEGREDSELDLGAPERRALARPDEVARDRDLESASEARATDQGDGRPRVLVEGADERLHGGEHLLAVLLGDVLLHRGAGREGLPLG